MTTETSVRIRMIGCGEVIETGRRVSNGRAAERLVKALGYQIDADLTSVEGAGRDARIVVWAQG